MLSRLRNSDFYILFIPDPNLFISLWFILMNGFGFLLRRISNNNIIDSIPSSLGDLEHLLKLDLSNNQLSGLIPQELSQLQNMVSLNTQHSRRWKQK
ncbi:uncharacterized protein [Arachis hypogaea]|uniref:uncharacterized protein isoform X2 n=1 Tax=Arachis hypogaea TaxID=3818 RepID=UPI0010FC5C73|nr:leucine-rich repeat protein 1 isoform X3 [Arachis hypogaea]